MRETQCNQLSKLAVLLLALAVCAVGAETWIELLPSGGPSNAILVSHTGIGGYDPANNRFIVYVPSNPAIFPNLLPEVWVLTNANGLGGAPVWTQLLTTGSAPNTSGGLSGFYDPGTNRLIVYGGCYSYCSPALGDVFALTNANGLGSPSVWSQISVTNPQPRAGHAAVYDSTNNRMISFGGNLAFTSTDQNDTSVLSNANGIAGPSSWITLSASGGLPPALTAHTAVYDQLANRMIVFGGRPTTGTTNNDVWILSNANGSGGTPTWSLQSPVGSLPPSRGFHSAVYDPVDNTLIIFGGSGSSGEFLGDLWKLSNANGLGGPTAWTQLFPAGTPPGPNVSHIAAYDTAHHRMMIFGGLDQNSVFHKRVWVLALGAAYHTCLLYDPTKAVKSGSTLPIKLQLCDAGGSNESSAAITLHAISITPISTSISGSVEDPGNANPDSDFRYDSTLGGTGGYIFNLKTTGLTTGTYTLNFTVSGDPTQYSTAFQVK